MTGVAASGAERGAPALAWAVGAPALLFVAAILVTAALTSSRRIAFLRDPHLTLAEAAALEDSGEIVRLLRHGADPRQPAHVRAGIIRDSEMVMTPIEAAITQGHADVIDLLVREGARIDRRNFPRLWCLSEQRRDPDVARVLTMNAPDAAAIDCSTVRTVLDEPRD